MRKAGKLRAFQLGQQGPSCYIFRHVACAIAGTATTSPSPFQIAIASLALLRAVDACLPKSLFGFFCKIFRKTQMNFLANPYTVSPFFFKPGTIQLLSETGFCTFSKTWLYWHCTNMLPNSPPWSVLSLRLSATKPNKQTKIPKKPYGCFGLNNNPGFASGYKGTPLIMQFLWSYQQNWDPTDTSSLRTSLSSSAAFSPPSTSLPDAGTPHLSEQTPLPLSAAFQSLSPSKFSVTTPSLSSSPISFQHLRLQFLLITSPSFQFLPKSQNFLVSKAGFPRNISRYSPFLHLP